MKPVLIREAEPRYARRALDSIINCYSFPQEGGGKVHLDEGIPPAGVVSPRLAAPAETSPHYTDGSVIFGNPEVKTRSCCSTSARSCFLPLRGSRSFSNCVNLGSYRSFVEAKGGSGDIMMFSHTCGSDLRCGDQRQSFLTYLDGFGSW